MTYRIATIVEIIVTSSARCAVGSVIWAITKGTVAITYETFVDNGVCISPQRTCIVTFRIQKEVALIAGEARIVVSVPA